MNVRPLAALAVCLLALSGCGQSADGAKPSDAGSSSVKPNGLYIRGDLVKMFAGKDPTKHQTEDAQCMTDKVLQARTYQDLQKAGVLDADYHVPPHRPFLDDTNAQIFAKAQDTCVNWYSQTTRHARSEHRRLDSTAFLACLRRDVTKDDIHLATVDYLTGHWQSDASKALTKKQDTCLSQAGVTDPGASSSSTADPSASPTS